MLVIVHVAKFLHNTTLKHLHVLSAVMPDRVNNDETGFGMSALPASVNTMNSEIHTRGGWTRSCDIRAYALLYGDFYIKSAKKFSH